MTRLPSFVALAFVLAIGFPTPSEALPDANCPGGEVGLWRTYLSVNNAGGDPRADADGRIRLGGWVYIPPGNPPKGGFPVLVFNHGSNKDTGDRCELAEYFVPRKYIFFVPVRRGHEGSTGVYYDDYANAQVNMICTQSDTFCDDALRRQLKRAFTMEYLRDQGDDVTDAINYIRNNYPKANPGNVAVIGHSFGGMVSLMWNMREGENTKVVISISAAAQSWGDANDPDDYLQGALRDAVRNAERPIYFLAPLNDKSTLPMAELPHEAGHRQMRWQAAVFTPVPDKDIEPCPRPDPEDPDAELTCGDVAHGKFVRLPSQIKKWGPSVVEFLKRFGVK